MSAGHYIASSNFVGAHSRPAEKPTREVGVTYDKPCGCNLCTKGRAADFGLGGPPVFGLDGPYDTGPQDLDPPRFADLVALEGRLAHELHPIPLKSHHEAYAVALEEFEEAWALVKSKDPDRAHLLREIVQAAAMLQRWAQDLGLAR